MLFSLRFMDIKVHRYLSFLKKTLLLLVFLLEAGCGTDPPFPRCVSADNFGLETIMASAYYSKDDRDSFKSKDGEDTAAFSPNQVVRWKDTGLVTTGEPIKVRTNGMWTAWAKSNKKYTPAAGVVELSDIENGTLNQSITPLDRTCSPYSVKDSIIPGCSNNKCQYIDENLKDDIKTGAYGIPCWFKNGYGAYLLFKRDGDPDPNQTVNIMRFPQSPVVHLGYKSTDEGGSGAFSSVEHFIKDSSCQNIQLKEGWKIYVKILDRYYWDNAGGYSFEFISGTKRENGIMIFETIRKEVKEILINQGGKVIFERIVKNDSFKNLVYSLLVLFLMISSLLYIFGMVQHPMPDFIARVLKISLIFMLISPNSWQFFYDHLLSLFIDGTDTIIGIINDHSGMSNYNQEAPFAFLDYMIRDKIFSPIVWNIKMKALIVSEFLGIFGTLFIIIAVLIYVLLCMYAFVIYLAGLIGMALLIALMPIFFVGILFSKLKSLFDGWLTQCISFSLQSIMIFTLLSLFGSLIMNTYYRLFGFTACYNKWMEVKLCVGRLCLLDSSFYAWTPGQKYVPKVIDIFYEWNAHDSLNKSDYGEDRISRFTFTGGGAVIPVPPEYTEKDFRYIDYPYFDPDITGSKNPDGISVIENSIFINLANLLNSLMALPTINGTAIARLVEDIKNEIKKLGLGNIQLRQIEDSKNRNIPNNYRQLQEDVKRALISLIGSNAINSTSKEELDKQYDHSIIKQIRKGHLIIWPELLILLLLALLMSLMRSFVTNIGSSLGGGSVMSTMLSGVWDGFFHPSGRDVGGKIGELIAGLKFGWQDKIGGGLEKTGSTIVNTVKRVPILGTAISFTSEATKAITMSQSEFEVGKKLDKQLKKLDYYRAVIGAHLSYSGLDTLKYLGKDAVDRMLGRKETGELEDIKSQHAFFMEKLRDKILGPEKHKPSTYLPPRRPEDDESPFPRSKPIDIDALAPSEGDVGSDAVDLLTTIDRDLDTAGQLKLKENQDINEILHARAKLLRDNDIDEFNRVDRLLHEKLGDQYDSTISNYESGERQPVEEDGASNMELSRSSSIGSIDPIAGESITSESDTHSQTSHEELRRDETTTQAIDEISSDQLQIEDNYESLIGEETKPRDGNQFQANEGNSLEDVEQLIIRDGDSDKGGENIELNVIDRKLPQEDYHSSKEGIEFNIINSGSNLEQEENIQIEIPIEIDDRPRNDEQLQENISPQGSDFEQSNQITSDSVESDYNTEDKPEQQQEALHSDDSQELEPNGASNKIKSSSSTEEKLEQMQEEQKKKREIEALQDKIEQVKEQQKSDRDESSDN